MRRKTAQLVGEQLFQRDGWSLGKQHAPLPLRLLHVKRDALLAGIAFDATFTDGERDILERVARGEPVIGFDLRRDIAQAQMRWLANGGVYTSDGDEGATDA